MVELSTASLTLIPIWGESGWGCSSDWHFQHSKDKGVEAAQDGTPGWGDTMSPACSGKQSDLLFTSSFLLEGQSSSAQGEGTKQFWCQ